MAGENRARKMAKKAGEAGKKGYRRGRKGFVVFITSDKILQAVLTGAVTAFVFSLNEGTAAYFQRLLRPIVPIFVPVKYYAAFGACLIVVVAYWADRNTEEWRSYVREKTGEETAKDTASEEDVAGDAKE